MSPKLKLKILWNHFLFRLKQLFREQAYVVSTLIFPALFYLIFALPNATDPGRALILMGSFSCFAVLSVAVLQFGVQLSSELRSGWSLYLRTLPISQRSLLLVDILRAFVMGALSIAVVVGAVLISYNSEGELNFSLPQALGLIGLLLFSALPFCVFSAFLAVWIKPEAALPIFNLIYILSSFAGGLWLPPNALPEAVQDISIYLPTRHLGEIAWAYLFDREWPKTSIEVLLGLFVLSLALYLASMSWRKTKGWRNV